MNALPLFFRDGRDMKGGTMHVNNGWLVTLVLILLAILLVILIIVHLDVHTKGSLPRSPERIALVE